MRFGNRVPASFPPSRGRLGSGPCSPPSAEHTANLGDDQGGPYVGTIRFEIRLLQASPWGPATAPTAPSAPAWACSSVSEGGGRWGPTVATLGHPLSSAPMSHIMRDRTARTHLLC